ncbi:unnamed protein product, partial [Prorocentrum cordatum]
MSRGAAAVAAALAPLLAALALCPSLTAARGLQERPAPEDASRGAAPREPAPAPPAQCQARAAAGRVVRLALAADPSDASVSLLQRGRGGDGGGRFAAALAEAAAAAADRASAPGAVGRRPALSAPAGPATAEPRPTTADTEPLLLPPVDVEVYELDERLRREDERLRREDGEIELEDARILQEDGRLRSENAHLLLELQRAAAGAGEDGRGEPPAPGGQEEGGSSAPDRVREAIQQRASGDAGARGSKHQTLVLSLIILASVAGIFALLTAYQFHSWKAAKARRQNKRFENKVLGMRPDTLLSLSFVLAVDIAVFVVLFWCGIIQEFLRLSASVIYVILVIAG